MWVSVSIDLLVLYCERNFSLLSQHPVGLSGVIGICPFVSLVHRAGMSCTMVRVVPVLRFLLSKTSHYNHLLTVAGWVSCIFRFWTISFEGINFCHRLHPRSGFVVFLALTAVNFRLQRFDPISCGIHHHLTNHHDGSVMLIIHRRLAWSVLTVKSSKIR